MPNTAQSTVSESKPLGEVTADDFVPHVGTDFAIPQEGEAPVGVVLTAVGRGATAPPGGRTPFTLTFQGTPGRVLPQRVYPLSHPALGVLEIFLVPLAATSEATTYEAVFG